MSAFRSRRRTSLHRVGHRPGAAGRDRRARHVDAFSRRPRAAFVGAEESVALVDAQGNGQGEISRVTVHGGGILCTASDGTRIVMGGDDGKLVALDAKGEVTLLAHDAKRRWIDNVALHPDGAVAWSAGKTAFVRSGRGEDKTFDMPSTVGGLAFAPKGLRRCGRAL